MDDEEIQRRRAQRARERQRRIIRRRIGALVAVLVVVAVVVIVIASSGGSSTPEYSGGAPVSPAHHRHDPRAARGARSHATTSATVAGAPPHGGDTAAALAAGTGAPGTASVPVLMYHVIAPPPAGAPFPGLYVPEPEFAAQMQALKAAGWHPVTLDQLRANWTRGSKLPSGKPIVLTFDNGYHSQYANALPILRRLGWVADENMQLTGLPPSQGGLTESEVRALIDAGWELDTQGISHADLITLDAAELHDQVAVARQELQRTYHVPVNWFCYPSGHYDETVIAAVRAAGFVGSTTVVPGWASPSSDPYRLPRLRVLGGTTPTELLAQIASAQTDAPPPSSYGGA
ncbi:MAG: polysaccharide deacetylase family protein [Solirubrobacteraceae bacterium]